MTRHGTQYPQLSAPVVYRNELGEDQAAIITGLVGDGLNVHLTVFPVEGDGMGSTPFMVSDVPPQRDSGQVKTWRWPEPTTIGG